MHRTYKRAEQKHIDVNAVPILQVEAFFLHGVILVDAQAKTTKTAIAFRPRAVLRAVLGPPPFDQTDVDLE